MDNSTIQNVEHVAEIGAVSYAVGQYARNGNGKGGTYVRNDAEYAGVAVGHCVAGGFFYFIWIHVFTFWAGATAMLLYALDYYALHQSMVGFYMLLAFWLYICIWRIGIKWPFKKAWKVEIIPADGYKGPLGISPTTYTGQPVVTQQPQYVQNNFNIYTPRQPQADSNPVLAMLNQTGQ